MMIEWNKKVKKTFNMMDNIKEKKHQFKYRMVAQRERVERVLQSMTKHETFKNFGIRKYY